MIEIKKNIYWDGIKDYDLRFFHGHEMSTPNGSSYNSFIIKDEKTALVDTVWFTHARDYMGRLSADVGIENIDYIIINHMEPDHGGSLEQIMDLNPNIEIFCTAQGKNIISKYFDRYDWNFHVVKTGDKLSLGTYELTFIEMPMIHWPDSMMTYVGGANLLISNDAFGQHYCPGLLFDDEVNLDIMKNEALKYYVNILTPYSALIKKKLAEVLSMNLKIDMIAPSHGIIWRSHVADILDLYRQWSDNYNDGSVIFVFDTMYGATKKMAEEIARPLLNGGRSFKIVNASISDGSDLIVDVFKAKMVVIGSSTVNNGMLNSIEAMLGRMKHMKFKDKLGAAFGSYGWSGEAPKQIAQAMKDMGITVVGEPLQFKYRLNSEEVDKCWAFGESLLKALE